MDNILNELIVHNENALAISEGVNFHDMFERIKQLLMDIIDKFKEFIRKIMRRTKEFINNDKKFIENNKENIERGYGVFQMSKSRIFGLDYHDAVRRMSGDFNNFETPKYFELANNDIMNIINSKQEVPSKIMDIDEEQEYIDIISSVLTVNVSTEIKKNGIETVLEEAYKLEEDDITQYYKPEDIYKYIKDENYGASETNVCKAYEKIIEDLNKNLAKIERLRGLYKSNIGLLDGERRSKCNKIVGKAIRLLKNYISIVNKTYGFYDNIAIQLKKYTMRIARLYIDLADKDTIETKHYDLHNKPVSESSLSYGIFEEVALITNI